MQFINVYDAKTHLSQYLDKIASGDEDIVICKNGKPIAKLSKYQFQAKRQLGLGAGKINMSPDFNTLPSDFLDYFS